MPIWLRKYTFKSIEEFYEKEREAQEQAHNQARGVETAQIPTTTAKPDIKPTYTTRASKK